MTESRSPITAAKTDDSQVPLAALVGDIIPGPRGDRHNRKRWLVAALRDKDCPVCDEDVFCIVELAEAVDHALLPILAHPRGPAFVDVLSENADRSGRLRILDLHRVEDTHHVIAHR